jgi:hypothetical protein
MTKRRISLRKYYSSTLLSAFTALTLMLFLAGCGSVTNASASTNTASTVPSKVATVPLKVVSVDMGLSIPSVSSYSCGTKITETYTATFHFPAHNAGGPVKFYYTTNNGRASGATALTVNPGQTTKAYVFSWSGTTNDSNTVPGPGGVMVTTPNTYTSEMLAPTGACTTASNASTDPSPTAAPAKSSAPFVVTSDSVAVTPDMTAHRCGSHVETTYTITFNIAHGGPGGTITFQYSTSPMAEGYTGSVKVAAGQTTATYAFTWSGTINQSGFQPPSGFVTVTAPNQLTMVSGAPVQGCTDM